MKKYKIVYNDLFKFGPKIYNKKITRSQNGDNVFWII